MQIITVTLFVHHVPSLAIWKIWHFLLFKLKRVLAPYDAIQPTQICFSCSCDSSFHFISLLLKSEQQLVLGADTRLSSFSLFFPLSLECSVMFNLLFILFESSVPAFHMPITHVSALYNKLNYFLQIQSHPTVQSFRCSGAGYILLLDDILFCKSI